MRILPYLGMLVLGLLVAPLLCVRADAQGPAVPTCLSNGPAATCCAETATGVVAATLYLPGLDPWLRAEFDVHEAVHRRQLADDCVGTLAAILASPDRLADVEAEAGCAQLRIKVPQPATRPDELGRLLSWLEKRVPGVPRSRLKLLISRRCGLWQAS